MTHIKACCESIARTGFGTLQISEAMLLDYKKIIDGYSTISPATKASFSFAKDTDGFFPLAPSTQELRISQICVSDFVTGLRTHQNERLLNSHEVIFLLPLIRSSDISVSLHRN